MPAFFLSKTLRIYFLSNQRFSIITDHKAVQYAFQKPDVQGLIMRWLDPLAEYDFDVEYHSGFQSGAADFLSCQFENIYENVVHAERNST